MAEDVMQCETDAQLNLQQEVSACQSQTDIDWSVTARIQSTHQRRAESHRTRTHVSLAEQAPSDCGTALFLMPESFAVLLGVLTCSSTGHMCFSNNDWAKHHPGASVRWRYILQIFSTACMVPPWLTKALSSNTITNTACRCTNME